jgi:hypothetical protein
LDQFLRPAKHNPITLEFTNQVKELMGLFSTGIRVAHFLCEGIGGLGWPEKLVQIVIFWALALFHPKAPLEAEQNWA